jgi:hypothetical protein
MKRYTCPRCGSDDVRIETRVVMVLNPNAPKDGYGDRWPNSDDNLFDHDPAPEDPASCQHCDYDGIAEQFTPAPPRDYRAASNSELAAWRRQYYRARHEGIRCEFGHPDCGCSNVVTMNGHAPCIQRVTEEQERRARARHGSAEDYGVAP